jgi:hypothetical protein
MGIFSNKAHCSRLVSAIPMKIDDAWQTGRVYMTFEKEDSLAFTRGRIDRTEFSFVVIETIIALFPASVIFSHLPTS